MSLQIDIERSYRNPVGLCTEYPLSNCREKKISLIPKKQIALIKVQSTSCDNPWPTFLFSFPRLKKRVHVFCLTTKRYVVRPLSYAPLLFPRPKWPDQANDLFGPQLQVPPCISLKQYSVTELSDVSFCPDTLGRLRPGHAWNPSSISLA